MHIYRCLYIDSHMHSICDLLSKMFSKISTTFTLVILVLHLKNAMKNAIVVIENPKIQKLRS